jgi:sec-independent protein translocase protein TatA
MIFAMPLGFWELLIIAFIILLLFGARRLPELGRSLGKGMREFKEGIGDSDEEKQPPKRIELSLPARTESSTPGATTSDAERVPDVESERASDAERVSR